MGKVFETIAESNEKWYGTSYKMEKIEKEQLELWRNSGLLEKFQLPPKNEFIPENLSLVTREEVLVRSKVTFLQLVD